MIPAKTRCPSTWTLEYSGYLMSTHRVNHYRTMFECVDKNPDSIPGSASDNNGSTIQKPAAMECLVYLMILRRNIHVQFVPNSQGLEFTLYICEDS